MNLAFKHAVHIDFNIGFAVQFSAQIESRRVCQAHAVQHQFVCFLQLISALQLGQLLRTVNACHLQFVLNAMRHNRHAIGHRPLHHIGEVVLTLCILVVEFGQPSFELFGGHGHDAAVHLLNFQLLWAGIFLLNDGQHAVAFYCAHNAAVA